jgi:putative transposase
MPDHIHLLLQDSNIIDFVRLFKGRMTPMARSLERSRKFWQRSFFDHGIRNDESLEKTARYIWENPVRKDMVNHPSEYTWSGSEIWPNWIEIYRQG